MGREETTLWDLHKNNVTIISRDNFGPLANLCWLFFNLSIYLSGNLLGSFCLSINSTWTFQSFPFTNFTGFLQPDDGSFSTDRKRLKGGSVKYCKIDLVDDR